MSFLKGQAVTYIDHEGNQQGALVLVPDNANHEATIALVKRDASDPVLNSADFHDGLERKFNIDSTQDRIATVAAVRQKDADDTGTEQPALGYDDLRETIYSSPYTLPTGSFTPAPKVEETPAPQTEVIAGGKPVELTEAVVPTVVEQADAAAAGSGAAQGGDEGQKTE